MGRVGQGNRLDPQAVQKINVLVNAFMDKNVTGKTDAKFDEAKLTKQAKAEVSKQVAPYLKEGVEASVKNLVEKTIDKTIADSLKAAKLRLKTK
jgi:hypothetical protein